MDEGKGGRLKRIFAWIGILLFFLLIVNIFTIQFQIEASIVVYIILIILYLFVMRKNDGSQGEKRYRENAGGIDKDKTKHDSVD